MIQLYAHTDRLYTSIQDLPALGFIGVERLYFSGQVDAALAAKDARIQELSAALMDAITAKNIYALDAARLDKLPQCFHMLRFRDCQWHFTFDANRQYYSLRDAIDAYNHPAIPGIDQGQFLAECGGGNAAFGERNSGGTPE